ncbi:hypothetical protein CW706_01670 [Candidatus Bathyarchaeota archaeon]|nr:MAG: hypothetical protein CW706_01670 [Candidatus Bathyarchaeota archaeon]
MDGLDKKELVRVAVVFTCDKPNVPSWPYINFDYEGKAKEIMRKLNESLLDIEFTKYLFSSIEEVKQVDWKEKNFDGIVVYMIGGMWTGVAEAVIEMGYPTILVDDLYGGSGGFLRAFSYAKRRSYPIIGVASSNFKDVVEAISLFRVIKSLKNSIILDITDRNVTKISEKIKETFGIQVVRMSSEELNSYFENAEEEEAEKWADKWIKESLKVVEPTREEIVKSAKMYLALKKAMADNNADAVTIDCLNLYYGGKLPAYPCLALFQLNNEGSTGVCEADLDSTITQLMMRYLTGRPGYVSDPVIDTATNQIIYAHCVATNKVYGPNGLSNPYIIRSHSEDRKGASVQSLMPLGEIVTTTKINTKEKALCIHQGRTVANVEEDKACRTKLAVEVNVQKILENWNMKVDFGWHRVTFYGDWRRCVKDLAALLGMKIIEEDR